MDMAGNVWEQCIGGKNSGTNYNFTGVLGDGLLATTGYANTAGWPAWGGSQGGGGILRGGDWFTNDARPLQTSDRWNLDAGYQNLNQSRDLRIGGRGVR
jgi:hypothetical protein